MPATRTMLGSRDIIGEDAMDEPGELEVSRSALAVMIGLFAAQVAARVEPDDPLGFLASFRINVLETAATLTETSPATKAMIRELIDIAIPEGASYGGRTLAGD